MPVHHTVTLTEVDLDEATAARAPGAFAGVGRIHGTMRRAQQPSATVVEKAVGLKIHFQRDMATPVQICTRHAFEPDCEATAGFARVHNVERNCSTPFDEVGHTAQRNFLVHEADHRRFRQGPQALTASQSARLATECAT